MAKTFLIPQILLFDQKDPERIRNKVRLLTDVVSNVSMAAWENAWWASGPASQSQPCTGRSGTVVLNWSCRQHCGPV